MLLQARKAAHWPQAPGRIVKSTIEAKEVRNMEGESSVTNVPAIAYEFTANGFPRRGTRIAIGQDTGGANTEATLARYPVGANVVVHYNPKDPNDCVLDYSGPFKGTRQGCATSIASLSVIGGLIYFGYTNFDKLVAALPPDANPRLMVFTGLLGLVALGASLGARRGPKWPQTAGKVVSSTTEPCTQVVDGRHLTAYRPVVEYAYTVRDHEYRGQQITLNVTTAGSQDSAKATAAKYPAGASVAVFYDPANPGHAALTVHSPYQWGGLVVAAFLLAVAVYASALWR
jgi:hypothetical protein